MKYNEEWLKWAIELQSIAQEGLTYGKDTHDTERYEKIRDISAQMLSHKTGISSEKVKELFCSKTGYKTTKLDTRTTIFENDKIILEKENNE